MSEPAPGFKTYPDHQVRITPTDDHVRIRLGDVVLADTRHPLQVLESRHHPVWYLPLADVDTSRLTPTAHTTYCPFKGHASYWTADVDGTTLENAVWSYPDPYRECLSLLGYAAFYPDRFTLEVNGVAEPGPDRAG